MVELTLVLERYAIKWHLPDPRKQPVNEALRRLPSGQNDVFVLPHPSFKNNRWLKSNDWFEGGVVPRIGLKVAQLLVDMPGD